jgi:hypothetical protein
MSAFPPKRTVALRGRTSLAECPLSDPRRQIVPIGLRQQIIADHSTVGAMTVSASRQSRTRTSLSLTWCARARPNTAGPLSRTVQCRNFICAAICFASASERAIAIDSKGPKVRPISGVSSQKKSSLTSSSEASNPGSGSRSVWTDGLPRRTAAELRMLWTITGGGDGT